MTKSSFKDRSLNRLSSSKSFRSAESIENKMDKMDKKDKMDKMDKMGKMGSLLIRVDEWQTIYGIGGKWDYDTNRKI